MYFCDLGYPPKFEVGADCASDCAKASPKSLTFHLQRRHLLSSSSITTTKTLSIVLDRRTYTRTKCYHTCAYLIQSLHPIRAASSLRATQGRLPTPFSLSFVLLSLRTSLRIHLFRIFSSSHGCPSALPMAFQEISEDHLFGDRGTALRHRRCTVSC